MPELQFIKLKNGSFGKCFNLTNNQRYIAWFDRENFKAITSNGLSSASIIQTTISLC